MVRVHMRAAGSHEIVDKQALAPVQNRYFPLPYCANFGGLSSSSYTPRNSATLSVGLLKGPSEVPAMLEARVLSTPCRTTYGSLLVVPVPNSRVDEGRLAILTRAGRYHLDDYFAHPLSSSKRICEVATTGGQHRVTAPERVSQPRGLKRREIVPQCAPGRLVVAVAHREHVVLPRMEVSGVICLGVASYWARA